MAASKLPGGSMTIDFRRAGVDFKADWEWGVKSLLTRGKSIDEILEDRLNELVFFKMIISLKDNKVTLEKYDDSCGRYEDAVKVAEEVRVTGNSNIVITMIDKTKEMVFVRKVMVSKQRYRMIAADKSQ